MELKVVGKEDHAIVISLMKDFYASFDYPFNAAKKKAALDLLQKEVHLGKVSLIVIDNKVAGYFALSYGFGFSYDGKDILLDEFYITDDFRSMGIGGKVMDLIKQEAIETGARSVRLEVEKYNTGAIKLYERMGFVQNPRIFMEWSPEGK